MLPSHFCLKRRKVDKLDSVTKFPISKIEKRKQKTKLDIFTKMIEMDKPVNIHTIREEIEDDTMIRDKSKEEENESKLNPYQMPILNKKSKDDAKTEQMINWPILSDRMKYVDKSSCSGMIPSLTIRQLDDKRHKRLYNSLKTDETLIPDIIFDKDRI